MAGRFQFSAVLTAKTAVLLYPLKATNRRKQMAYTISEECIACGACLPECPVEAIKEGDKYSIDAAACIQAKTAATAQQTVEPALQYVP